MTTNSTVATSGDKSTYFSYSLSWRDASHGSMGSSEDTLSAAISSAFIWATYYLGTDHQDVRIDYVRETCAECNGLGKIRQGIVAKPKRCPTCKGKNSQRVIVENVPVAAHPEMAIVNPSGSLV